MQKRTPPIGTPAPIRAARALALALLLALSAAFASGATPPTTLDYDVVVVGAEPEAVAAAIAAAESGARTLLISEAPRLGGLFVRGALNVLDLRVTPADFQLGVFDRWWRRNGRHHAFDVAQAERIFAQMLAEAGVEVRLQSAPIAPLLDDGRVVGIELAEGSGGALRAGMVIDATEDADLAAAAGAPSRFGFEELGWPVRMADTLVLRIDGVNWPALQLGANLRGRDYAYVDAHVAYGHFAGVPAAYRPLEPGLRLRGLNIGRQSDGSVLINALLIYGINPFDPESRAEGIARAQREAPRIVEYLAGEIPGFGRARLGGFADDLYVRQTRHTLTECRLSIDDVLDHRVEPTDIAKGGYPLDVQTLQPTDTGFVFGLPEIYGGRLCMMVPLDVDGLWVVGRSAGFDPIAQSSARVVPFGMAMAEAAGVAAAMALELGVSPRAFIADEARLVAVREELGRRGAALPVVAERRPAGPVDHPHYGAYRSMLRWGLALGGYSNDPRLDDGASGTSLIYLLSNLAQRAFDDPAMGRSQIERFGLPNEPLQAELAARIVGDAIARLEGGGAASSWSDLQQLGFVGAPPDGALSRGEVYALASWILERNGRSFPTP